MTNKRLTKWLTFDLSNTIEVRKLFFAYFPNETESNFNPYYNDFKKNNVIICIKVASNPLNVGVTYKKYYVNSVKTK